MRLAAVAVTVALVLPACGGGGGEDEGLPDTIVDEVVTTTTSTTEPPTPEEDLELAATVVTEPGDLAGGWEECCPPTVYSPASLREHICGSPKGLPPHTAGYTRFYAQNLQPDGMVEAQIDSSVLIADSEKAAAEEWEAVRSPGYRDCVIESVERAVVDRYSEDPTPEVSSTYERIDLRLGEDAIADRIDTTVAGDSGLFRAYNYRVRAHVGRVITRMEITSFPESMSIDNVKRIVIPMLRRIAQEQGAV